jgi:hypothetical protein
LPSAKVTTDDVVEMVLLAPVAMFTMYPDHDVPDGNPLSDTDTVKVDDADATDGITIIARIATAITTLRIFIIFS